MLQRGIKVNIENRVGIYFCLFWIVLWLPAQGQVSYSKTGFSVPEQFIPQGTYLPFFSPRRSEEKNNKDYSIKPIEVNAFRMDAFLVTNENFINFVKANPDWRRSQVKRVFADVSYLKHWKSDLKLNTVTDLTRPVTQVSWFSASAYCQSKGKDLPTTDQWEYVAGDSGRESKKIKNMILEWYSSPNSNVLPSVRKGYVNGYGVHNLFGVTWEWTLDFNSTLFGSETRNNGTKDENLFCGAGSLGALDASDYAKFMRYSFRSSLKADYTTENLGFRCARGAVNEN